MLGHGKCLKSELKMFLKVFIHSGYFWEKSVSSVCTGVSWITWVFRTAGIFLTSTRTGFDPPANVCSLGNRPAFASWDPESSLWKNEDPERRSLHRPAWGRPARGKMRASCSQPGPQITLVVPVCQKPLTFLDHSITWPSGKDALYNRIVFKELRFVFFYWHILWFKNNLQSIKLHH